MTLLDTARRRAALRAAVLALAAASAACSADRLVVPNQNSATPQGAATDPTGAVNFLAGGIQATTRDALGGWVLGTGILGREAFNYTGTEGRNTTGYLINPDDPTAFAASSAALFSTHYVNLRNILLFRGVVETAPLTAPQKSAATGFADTYEALELHYVILRSDTIGASVEVYTQPDSIAPFVSRDTGLRAGGTAFPFTLGTGFAGFNTPATFLTFNRALAARVLAIRGSIGCGASCYTQALAALGESFIDPAGDLQRGVYATFSTASGETTNAATSFGGQARVVVAHPSTATDAPTRADGTPDLRLAAKTTALATPVNPSFCASGSCIPTSLGFRRYPEQTTPIPIIKNEELVLLRAEARYFTGDVAGAVADINTVRTRSGGLAPIAAGAVATPAAFVTELLTQRRYSLLFEGHRWVDARRFGRLNTLPLDRPNHKVVGAVALPQQECLSRTRTGSTSLIPPQCP
jgi:hypothetical protein